MMTYDNESAYFSRGNQRLGRVCAFVCGGCECVVCVCLWCACVVCAARVCVCVHACEYARACVCLAVARMCVSLDGRCI